MVLFRLSEATMVLDLKETLYPHAPRSVDEYDDLIMALCSNTKTRFDQPLQVWLHEIFIRLCLIGYNWTVCGRIDLYTCFLLVDNLHGNNKCKPIVEDIDCEVFQFPSSKQER